MSSGHAGIFDKVGAWLKKAAQTVSKKAEPYILLLSELLQNNKVR